MAVQFYDEMPKWHDGDRGPHAAQPAPAALVQQGKVRSHYGRFAKWLGAQPATTLQNKRARADLIFHHVGTTFAVYGDEDESNSGTERTIPFDIIPCIFPVSEWATLERGLRQRADALDRLLHDIYHEQNILRAGVIPPDQTYNNVQYRPDMLDVNVPCDIYAHVADIDIVRAGEDEFYVLEDNLRVPSGISYMLENRKMMMRLFLELFAHNRVASVAHYPDMLLGMLCNVSPQNVADPTVVVLTPGMYNSAYFEHVSLAQQMGVGLVEGHDLFVQDDHLYMRMTQGPQHIDVICRRVDDDFLDPFVSRPGSSLGAAGLLSVYRVGNMTICDAIGTGVTDDKSIYPYVPDMIRFYLGEESISNNVPTYMCRRSDDLQYVLDHMGELVVKKTYGAGGYGMLVGPAATQEEIAAFREVVKACPDQYIAQPTLALSTYPTYVEAGIAPHYIDLRPFVLSGKDVHMVPGGLTRVALRAGSLVVNSSQDGGTKDTWVLER